MPPRRCAASALPSRPASTRVSAALLVLAALVLGAAVPALTQELTPAVTIYVAPTAAANGADPTACGASRAAPCLGLGVAVQAAVLSAPNATAWTLSMAPGLYNASLACNITLPAGNVTVLGELGGGGGGGGGGRAMIDCAYTAPFALTVDATSCVQQPGDRRLHSPTGAVCAVRVQSVDITRAGAPRSSFSTFGPSVLVAYKASALCQPMMQSTLGGTLLFANMSDIDLSDVHITLGGGQLGGALSVCSMLALRVTNCSFVNNTASIGGAMVVTEGAQVFSVTGSLFADNQARASPGQLARAGALYSESAYVLTNCTFLRNGAFPHPFSPTLGAHGGAIYTKSIMAPTIQGSTFVENGPSTAGGAVYFCTAFTISASTFSANTLQFDMTNSADSVQAIGGAAVFADLSADCAIGGSTISDSFMLDHTIVPSCVHMQGGALAVFAEQDDVQVIFALVRTVIARTRVTRGADVCSSTSMSYDTRIVGVAAGLTLTSDSVTGFLVSDSTFSDNSCDGLDRCLGGGVGIVMSFSSSLHRSPLNYAAVVVNSVFRRNTVSAVGVGLSAAGGALFVSGISSTVGYVQNMIVVGAGCLFDSNVASGVDDSASGGAVHIVSSESLQVNIVGERDSRIVFHNNSAPSGGAFSSHVAGSLVIEYTDFNFGQAYYCAGMLVLFPANLTVSLSSFSHNDAYFGSAAVSAIGDPTSVSTLTVSFTDVLVNDNRALMSTQSAAAFTVQNVVCTLTRVFFLRNSFHYGAGALGTSVLATSVDCTFEDNASTSDGAALYLSFSTWTDYGSVFSSNQAPMSAGGAVAIDSVSKFEAYGTVFSGNVAEQGGAVFCQGSMSCTNCQFVANNATPGAVAYSQDAGVVSLLGSGGAVCADSNLQIQLLNSSFLYNSAVSGGALTGSRHTTFVVSEGCTFVSNFACVGGAVYLTDVASLFVDDAHFRLNSASASGGAIYTHSSSYVELGAVDFSSNSAVFYGGVLVSDVDAGILSWFDLVAFNNTAAYGGAMAIFPKNIGLAQSTTAHFSTNVASHGGGALYFLEPMAPADFEADCDDCTFDANRAQFGPDVSSTPATLFLASLKLYSQDGNLIFTSSSEPTPLSTASRASSRRDRDVAARRAAAALPRGARTTLARVQTPPFASGAPGFGFAARAMTQHGAARSAASAFVTAPRSPMAASLRRRSQPRASLAAAWAATPDRAGVAPPPTSRDAVTGFSPAGFLPVVSVLNVSSGSIIEVVVRVLDSFGNLVLEPPETISVFLLDSTSCVSVQQELLTQSGGERSPGQIVNASATFQAFVSGLTYQPFSFRFAPSFLAPSQYGVMALPNVTGVLSPCPAGFAMSSGTCPQCSSCPPGTFSQLSASNATCSQCPVGVGCVRNLVWADSPDVFALYLPQTNAILAEPCDSGMSSGACVEVACDPLNPLSNPCTPGNNGSAIVRCRGTLDPSLSPAQVQAVYDEQMKVGTLLSYCSGLNNCSVGYRGFLCSDCDDGYAFWSDRCVECTDPAYGMIVFNILLNWGYVAVLHMAFAMDRSAEARIIIYFFQVVILILGRQDSVQLWLSFISYQPSVGTTCPFPRGYFGSLLQDLVVPIFSTSQLLLSALVWLGISRLIRAIKRRRAAHHAKTAVLESSSGDAGTVAATVGPPVTAVAEYGAAAPLATVVAPQPVPSHEHVHFAGVRDSRSLTDSMAVVLAEPVLAHHDATPPPVPAMPAARPSRADSLPIAASSLNSYYLANPQLAHSTRPVSINSFAPTDSSLGADSIAALLPSSGSSRSSTPTPPAARTDVPAVPVETKTELPVAAAAAAAAAPEQDKHDNPREFRASSLSAIPRGMFRRRFADRWIVRPLVSLMLSIYTPLTTAASFALHCRDIGGASVLAYAPHVMCTSAVYAFYYRLALAAILVVSVGFPVLSMIFLLVAWRRNKLDDPTFRMRYGYFYECYKPQRFWWEVLVLLRRLLLTGLSLINGAGRDYSLMVAALLNLFVHLGFAPYTRRLNNLAETVALGGIVLVAGTRASALYDTPSVVVAIRIALTVFTIAVAAAMVVLLILSYRGRIQRALTLVRRVLGRIRASCAALACCRCGAHRGRRAPSRRSSLRAPLVPSDDS